MAENFTVYEKAAIFDRLYSYFTDPMGHDDSPVERELEKAKADNAKLRDIARRQHEIIITQYCPEYDSMRCKEECPLYHSKDDCEVTRIMDELEELGVEVDE